MNTVNPSLQELHVGDVMTAHPVVIGSGALAREAERLLKQHRVSGLPVVDHEEALGVISQSDLVVARSSQLICGNWERLRVRHIMSTPAVAVQRDTSLSRAARLMIERHIHRVVIVDAEQRPVGIVSSLDLLRPIVESGG